jgi:hypothetical protein
MTNPEMFVMVAETVMGRPQITFVVTGVSTTEPSVHTVLVETGTQVVSVQGGGGGGGGSAAPKLLPRVSIKAKTIAKVKRKTS